MGTLSSSSSVSLGRKNLDAIADFQCRTTANTVASVHPMSVPTFLSSGLNHSQDDGDYDGETWIVADYVNRDWRDYGPRLTLHCTLKDNTPATSDDGGGSSSSHGKFVKQCDRGYSQQ